MDVAAFPAYIGNYKTIKRLGSGSYGLVVSAVSPSGSNVAIKILNKSNMREDQIERTKMEIAVMKQLRHPNIIQIYEVIETPSHVNIVMEFADGGSLLETVEKKKKLTEEEARVLYWGIVRGLEYAHSHMVIHRDLKCENIFVTKSGEVKLGDWGFGGFWQPGQKQNASYGSLYYASPEICQGREYVGPEVDCWSMGVMLFAMVTGTLPFYGAEAWAVAQRIITGTFNTPAFLSRECQQLLKLLLQPLALRRGTIYDIINSAWLNNTNKAGTTTALPGQRTVTTPATGAFSYNANSAKGASPNAPAQTNAHQSAATHAPHSAHMHSASPPQPLFEQLAVPPNPPFTQEHRPTPPSPSISRKPSSDYTTTFNPGTSTQQQPTVAIKTAAAMVITSSNASNQRRRSPRSPPVAIAMSTSRSPRPSGMVSCCMLGKT